MLVYINIIRVFIRVKKLLEMKNKKLFVFSFYINIANFEAFRQHKKLSSNLFFLKSEVVSFVLLL